MADNKKSCEEKKNPPEESELEESSQQESLQPQPQTSQPQTSQPQQSEGSPPASTSQRDPFSRLVEKMASPNFNPAKLSVEEQIAYMRHKYSKMDDIPYPLPPRRAPRQEHQPPPQPQPVLHSRVPSLGSPERRKFHYDLYVYKSKLYNAPYYDIESSSSSSGQAVQQRSSRTPPESQSENYSQEKAQGWLSVLRKHEKEQNEKTKKEQEEKSKMEQEEKTKKEQEEKTKKEQEEKTKIEQEENAKKEQEGNATLKEEEQYRDVDSSQNPDI